MNKGFVLLSLVSVFFAGQCAYATNSSGNGERSMKLSERHSGYALDSRDWIDFLTCWKNSIPNELEFEDEAFLLSFSGDANSLNLENFRFRLPKSVLDFYQAYESLGGRYRSPKISDGLGVLAPKDVKPLSEYMPDFLEIRNESPWESSDVEYFRYGAAQDSGAYRTSRQNSAIVIGQYGYSDYELIVLYPDSLTKDGEMEAALFALASEARAPSFAEMMRQLSHYFTDRPREMPIFSQETLKGTCADKLPLKDVWWK